MGALAGLALGGASGLLTPGSSRAADQAPASLGAYGDDVSDLSSEKNSKKKKRKKRKKKRCKRVSKTCRRDVAAWCDYYWLDYYTCVASLGSCCSYIRKCKFGRGNRCIDNNPYYFLV